MVDIPIRVIIACNTSHIIMAKAFLATKPDSRKIKTLLLLADYNHAAKLTYQQMNKLAETSPEFDKVQWVNDIMSPINLKLDALSINDYITALQGSIANGQPESVVEYWTWSIFNRYEQLLAEAFPESSIVLYEDGLALYVDRGASKKCPTTESQPHWILNNKGISTHHLERLISIPSLLGRQHELPHYIDKTLLHPIDKNSYIKVIQEAATCFGMELEGETDSNVSNVLVIGTPMFDLLDNYSWNEEFTLYKKVIEKLIYDENCAVYWKEHPFISKPFSTKLSRDINSDRFYVVRTPQGAPAEYIALLINISKTISIGSSAQSIMFELFGIPYAVIQQPGLEIVDKAGKSLADFRRASPPYKI